MAKLINIPIDDDLDKKIEEFKVLNNFKSKKGLLVSCIAEGLGNAHKICLAR